MDLLILVMLSPIPAAILTGFVIFGFNRIKFPKPFKVFLLLVALTALGMGLAVTFFIDLFPGRWIEWASLLVLSGSLCFGIKFIELPKPAKICLFLLSMLVFVFIFYVSLVLYMLGTGH